MKYKFTVSYYSKISFSLCICFYTNLKAQIEKYRNSNRNKKTNNKVSTLSGYYC